MDVAAKQGYDLRVTADQITERHGLLGPPVAADVVVADVKRRVVNEQQRRAIRLIAQNLLEPCLALRAKDTLALTRRGRIESDQAKRMVLDHVMKETPVTGQAGLVTERFAQGNIVVSIARNEVERCLQRRKQLEQLRVLFRSAVLHRIAGKDYRIGLLPIDIRDTCPQAV